MFPITINWIVKVVKWHQIYHNRESISSVLEKKKKKKIKKHPKTQNDFLFKISMHKELSALCLHENIKKKKMRNNMKFDPL